jgi:sec-independent protein translocase protein TatB
MGSEIIFIFLLALILFGPKKLPVMAREIGKFVAEFKRASNDFKQQLQAEIEKAGQEDSATQRGQRIAQKSSGASPSAPPPSIQSPALPPPAGESFDVPPAPDTDQNRLLRSAQMAYDSKNSPERAPLVPDTSSAPPPIPLPPHPIVDDGAEKVPEKG